jgi:CelD/BcsL family acetyltransferase involved in cellulose biosynthesis
MFEVAYARGITGLREIRPIWEDLYVDCRSPSFYNHWFWHESLSTHLLDGDMHYFLLSQGGQYQAIFPLQQTFLEKGGYTWRVFSLPRHSHLKIMDALIKQDMDGQLALHTLVRYLQTHHRSGWDMLSFPRVAERANLVPVLSQANIRLDPIDRCFYLRAGPKAPPETQLSRKHLKNVDRLWRKAEADHGTLAFEHCTEPARLETAFRTFLEVEASGWKGEQGKNTCIKANPRHEAHYRHLLQRFAPGGSIAVNLLHVNDRTIAGQLCIRAFNVWHLMKIAYDEAFQAYAPGHLLLHLFIQELAGLSEPWEINLVTGPVWAERWHFSEETVYCADLYNRNLRGQLLSTFRIAKALLKSKNSQSMRNTGKHVR